MIAKRTWQTVVTVLAACIFVYFLYHTIQGDHGWMAMLRMKNQVSAAQTELTALQKQHQDMDHHIHMLRPESTDPDLLDEQARKSLDYAKPNEVIILTPPDNKKSQ